MKLIVVKDHEGSEAMIDIERLVLVSKPMKKSCKAPKLESSFERYVLELYLGNCKTALFFNDEESAMDQYQEIVLAAKEVENRNFMSELLWGRNETGPQDYTISNGTTEGPTDWEYIQENYTPGRGDVGISPIK